MEQTQDIAELYGALAIAQSKFVPAEKDGVNPHHGYTYSSLSALIAAARIPLSEVGLCILQPARTDGVKVTVKTILAHKSGQSISEEFVITAKSVKEQDMGAAVTYARKYGYAAMVGVATEEDSDATDGAEGGERRGRRQRGEEGEREEGQPRQQAQKRPQLPEGTAEKGTEILAQIKAAKTKAELDEAKKGVAAFKWTEAVKAQLYTAGADKKEELRKATLPEPGAQAVVNFPATKERQPGDDEEEMPPTPAPAGQAATASGGPTETMRVMALIDESPTLADLSKLVPRIQALPPDDVGPTKKHYLDRKAAIGGGAPKPVGS